MRAYVRRAGEANALLLFRLHLRCWTEHRERERCPPRPISASPTSSGHGSTASSQPHDRPFGRPPEVEKSWCGGGLRFDPPFQAHKSVLACASPNLPIPPTPAAEAIRSKLCGDGGLGQSGAKAPPAPGRGSEVPPAGLQRVAAWPSSASRSAPAGASLSSAESRSKPGPAASIRPRKYCAAVRPRLRILGSSSSARSAISRKQRRSSAASATGAAAGSDVGAAAIIRLAASSTLSMPRLVNGKGGRGVAGNG